MDREVQQQFGAVAANYVHSTVHSQGTDLPVLVEAAELTGQEEVLDLGTAAGHTALTFAPLVARVTGVDLTDEMLIEARALASQRQISNVRFVHADVCDLPFDSRSFDLVTSRFSAHHYAQPREVAHEIARVLRPGGRFILSDTVAPEDPALDTFINTIELLRDRSHVRDHTINQWRDLLADAGLASKVYQAWDLTLDFDEWVTRMRTPADAVAMLRTLLTDAPGIARRAFQIRSRDRLSFCLKCVILRAWPA